MLTPAEALRAIVAALPAAPTETVALADVHGRVLAQPVVAERDQPPFDRVTMDGIALRYAAFAGGTRRFSIAGRQHAGDPPLALTDDDACIEIMTGAMLPPGADIVVPVERLTVADGHAEIESGYVAEANQFVHPRGSDHTSGRVLLEPGHRVEPTDVAVIASAGLDRVVVAAQPTVRIVATGDELVPAGAPILDHQIRLSNGPALVAMLKQHGYGDSDHEHLTDERKVLERRLEDSLATRDVLILSGGVSMGKADFVPEVLTALGVKKVFHRISQRPGKPMWFGIGPKGQAVFALPGNPVSTLVCCRQYVLPGLAHAAGLTARDIEQAALSRDYRFKPVLTCFLPVRVHSDDDGRLLAEPVPTNTSGDFAALSGTDGYVELPSAQVDFPAASVWPLRRWQMAGS